MKKISLVVTGDSIITMKQSVHSEPRFLEMVNIIRGADLAFTNLEMLLHDYEGYPANRCDGTWMRAPPEMIEELKWMGFDIVSTANNHSLDYMYGGLFKTKDYLNLYGVPHAGTGKDLQEARQPTYMDTPQGRVALIAAASTFAPRPPAGAARRDMQGRPGLNPLRYDTWFTVKPETMVKLKALEEEMDIQEVVQSEDENEYYIMRKKFVIGEDVGMHSKPNKVDMEGNLESIRDAARQADWVFFSLHAHEGRWKDRDQPADFIEEFSREAIDAGAHAIIGHGHHAMRGIEIRDGRPIFYGLGDFILQSRTLQKMPAEFYEHYNLDPYSGTPSDAFDARLKSTPRAGSPPRDTRARDKNWISVIPYMKFEDDRITELKLHPIELGQTKPRSQRGRPMMAEPELANKILGIIKKLSEPYGTKITVEDGFGTVDLMI